MNYRMVLAYDGTAYHGWQAQGHCVTVSGMLEQRFKVAFKCEAAILGASRTDAGVHALGQVALLTTPLHLDVATLKRVFNEHLPCDIHIRSIELAHERFHPLRDVTQKTYYYHFFTRRPLPFVARYGIVCRTPLLVERVLPGLHTFVGTHDFRSFCTGDHYETTVRTIESVDFTYFKRYGMYRITIRGPRFMQYMIRRIVGAVLDVAGRPERLVSQLREALEARDPRQQLPTAPARGLLLRSVHYQEHMT